MDTIEILLCEQMSQVSKDWNKNTLDNLNVIYFGTHLTR